MSILDRRSLQDLRNLAVECGFMQEAGAILDDFEVHKQAHRSAQISPGRAGDLERRWYASLAGGNAAADYSVYGDPFYLVDLWLCWTLYSRKALQALVHPTSMACGSVRDYFGAVRSVLDCGCGFGYTTAALKELFPAADVTGTNLRSSFQFQVASTLGTRHGFAIVEQYAGAPVDVLVASEYFEHFAQPIEHAQALLATCRPSHLVIANGFNGRSIGHFDTYAYRGKSYTAAEMSRLFSATLRELGYHSVKTRIWNNRPAVWSRQQGAQAMKTATKTALPSRATPAAAKATSAMPWPADHVERRAVAELVPNARNARQHSTEQVRELAASIREWGWTIPVLIDEQGGLIAGHGRVLAAEQLGLTEIPVMTARGWSETQKRAYMLADNQLALHATWDYDLLKVELTELRADGIDLGLMGFGEMDLADIFAPDADEALKRYVQAVNTPVYEPKGDKPEVKDLVDRSKAQDLMNKIREAVDLSEAERDFLLLAAARHNVFDYHQIAEFYCHASETVQALMEDSALVIIDFDKAIGDGFVRMSKRLDEVFLRSYPEGDGPEEGDLEAGVGHGNAL